METSTRYRKKDKEKAGDFWVSTSGISHRSICAFACVRNKARSILREHNYRGIDLKPIKRLEHYILAFFKLGRTERLAKEAHRNLHENRDLADRVAQQSADLEARMKLVAQDTRDLTRDLTLLHDSRFAELSRSYADLTRRMDQLLLHLASDPKPTAVSPAPSDDGIDTLMDGYYERLENRFRGSREDIARRLRVYLPEIDAAAMRTGGKPVLDLGCGRGELLELLRDSGVSAWGADINPMQLESAQAKGLDARQMDARTALEQTPDNSLSVVTAHHLIEHLPFRDVAWITREALRVLAPGGMLLFETPNVRNVLVGATSFHNDPTHLKPMTEPVMSVLLETVGFHPVETRFLNPHERLDEFLDKSGLDPELTHLLFGAQDLCIIGRKS